MVGLFQRHGEHAVAHPAAVDEEGLVGPAGAGDVGRARETPDGGLAVLQAKLQHAACHLRAVESAQHVGQRAAAGRGEDGAAVAVERQAQLRVGHGVVGHDPLHRCHLARAALEELEARGHRGKEVAHGHRGAVRQAARRGRGDVGALRVHDDTMGCPGRTRGQLHFGHGGDAGQRLAAEAERADVEKVVEHGQLAGGVALEGQVHLAGRDAAAVVLHADERLSSPLKLDAHARGAGVDGVLQQLLHHGGRALDHFARGDLGGQGGIELVDRRPAISGYSVGHGGRPLIDRSYTS